MNTGAADFLLLNGFKQEGDVFKNDRAEVKQEDGGYNIHSADGDFYTQTISIYTLIGYLTYYNYMERNYKTLNDET